MAWTIKYSAIAAKQMKKFDKSIANKIDKYLNKRVAPLDDATKIGEPLKGDKSGYWRYRYDDYRIICEIKNNELTVLVLRFGHRKEVYKK